ncbi:hypothetical protein OS493_037963, partial [Desmophyllum pertusum]
MQETSTIETTAIENTCEPSTSSDVGLRETPAHWEIKITEQSRKIAELEEKLRQAENEVNNL